MASSCPFVAGQQRAHSTVQQWWPNRADLSVLKGGVPSPSNPSPQLNYAAEFQKLDLRAVVDDLKHAMTDSQDWWPADYGHYGPLFVRMAWHSAGTYRATDGRGGAGGGLQRFAPLNSWPDNANLDKARRLLWPIKQKYGERLSWADLLILAGNVALDSMGMPTIGFAGGREDAWDVDDTDWGPEATWLGDERYSGDRELKNPLAAVQMGLIYVNPEGPGGKPDPVASARDIRDTFGRMSMNDEETVALIAGGHTFGKCHGAASAKNVGPEPEGAPIEAMGLGWKNSFGKGKGEDTITSGLEGAWTTNPTKWDNNFFDNLFGFDWELYKSPAGAWQWRPTGGAGSGTVPDAHNSSKRHAPMMLTSDLALRMDPIYEKISRRFHADPQAFRDAFARAWFKLTHRDLGPRSRYVGPLVPSVEFIWQDPVPAHHGPNIGLSDIASLKQKVLASGLTTAQLIRTAWASASTFRGTDKRGGANGARIRLQPQCEWAVNEPAELATVLRVLEGIKREHNAQNGIGVSVADLIVLAGTAAIEKAAAKGGVEVQVPFSPGRTDATASNTDAPSFSFLEPRVDGFRNYPSNGGVTALVERARLLTLTAPEMTVLIGGLRVLGANFSGSPHGALTTQPGVLSNDFFVNLLDQQIEWLPRGGDEGIYEGRSRRAGSSNPQWSATQVDMVFGSHSQLRTISEVYASSGSKERFVRDFVAAWTKVMNLDRFDLCHAR